MRQSPLWFFLALLLSFPIAAQAQDAPADDEPAEDADEQQADDEQGDDEQGDDEDSDEGDDAEPQQGDGDEAEGDEGDDAEGDGAEGTDTEETEDADAETEDADAEAEDAETADAETEDADAEDAAEGDDAAGDAEPLSEPEPELSPTGASESDAEGETGADLDQTTDLEQDLEAARDEGAEEEEAAATDAEGEGKKKGKKSAEEGSMANRSASAGGLLSGGDSGPRWLAHFTWDQAFTSNTLNRDAQLSYNPTYIWSFSLRPGWRIRDDLTASVRQGLEVEMTQSDETTRENELWLHDTIVELQYTGIPSLWDIGFAVGPRLQLPASKSSRSAERILGTGFFAKASRPFDVLEGLVFGTSFGYNHWFATSNVPTTERVDGTPFPCHSVLSGGDVRQSCTALPVATTVRDSTSVAVTGSLSPIENLSLSAAFAWTWQFAHDLEKTTVETDTGDFEVGDTSPTHMRGLTEFQIAVGYDITDYLSASAAFYTPSPHLDTDGKRENPIWNERSQIYVSMTLLIDGLYSELSAAAPEDQQAAEGEEEEEAQVERAAGGAATHDQAAREGERARY